MTTATSPSRETQTPAATRPRHLVARATNLAGVVDTFLVAAVTCLVLNRAALAALGYPRVGGNGLHISHMLWGGLLLTIAFVSQIVYLGRSLRLPAAIMGGIGFGLFIDEIGKFVTSDNDYFFKPTFALIYVTLIAIYFIVQALVKHSEFTPEEYLANAFDFASEAALGRLDRAGQRTALLFLNRSGDDEVVQHLRALVQNAPLRQHRSLFGRQFVRFNRWYDTHRDTAGFRHLVAGIYAVQVLVVFGEFAAISVVVRHAWHDSSHQVLNQTSNNVVGLSFVAVIELLTALVCAFLVYLGVRRLAKDRIRAYRMFERAVLLSMFVTQVLVFFQSWFAAVVCLLGTLPAWVFLRLLVQREELTGDADSAVE